MENTNVTTAMGNNGEAVEVLTPSFGEEYEATFMATHSNDETAVSITLKGVEHQLDSKYVADYNRIKASFRASEMSNIVVAASVSNMVENGIYNSLCVSNAKALFDKLGFNVKKSMADKYLKNGRLFLTMSEDGEAGYKQGIPHVSLSGLDELATLAIDGDIAPVVAFCEAQGVSSFWTTKAIREAVSKWRLSDKGEDTKGEDTKGEDTKGEDTKGEDTKGEDTKGEDTTGEDTTTFAVDSKGYRANKALSAMRVVMEYIKDYEDGNKKLKGYTGALARYFEDTHNLIQKALESGEGVDEWTK